ncbi:MAG TPA: carbamate kinase [Clostridia bacterium]|nr:carbamate kinase [Clostridia bacterium]
MKETLVIALGGNAILQPGQRGTFEEQIENVRVTCKGIADLIEKGYRVVLTHGNGPQVGNILIQQEEGKTKVPAMPLDVCGAESQGLIGYMFQQSLSNELSRRGLKKTVVSLITQTVVDPEDPAFENPSKPVGPFYTEEESRRLAQEKGYVIKEDAGRGYRRVVPSPDPKTIVESEAIKALVDAGVIVICTGGGGIPVRLSTRDGVSEIGGVEAVIDKDLGAERLAHELKADLLMILTDVEVVYLNYRQPNQRALSEVTVAEAKEFLAEGHFRAGSMEPKVKAAIRFMENGGKRAIISSLEKLNEALEGKTGTHFVRK